MNELTKNIIGILAPFIFALLAWGLWLTEIVLVIGWDGLQWLYGSRPIYAAYLATGLVVLAYLLPILLYHKIPSKKLFGAATLLYFTAILMYWLAKGLIYLLYSPMLIFTSTSTAFSSTTLVLILGLQVFIFAIVIYLLHLKLFFPISALHILSMVTLFIMVISSSNLFIQQFPGYGTATDFVDAVKMGYPIFFLTLYLGLWSFLMAKRIV